MDVFTQDEVDEFADLHFSGKTPESWAHCLDVPVGRYEHVIDWSENGQADFKIGNSDPDAIETMSNRIIDDLIRQKRKGDMSLYKQYQVDADFKARFRQTIMRMAQTMQATPEYTRLTHVGFTQAAESGAIYKAK